MSSNSLDQLVQRISAEAKKIEPTLAAEPTPVRLVDEGVVPLPALGGGDWQALLHHDAIGIADLLAFRDDEFIELAYQALLGRPADPGGRDNIRKRLSAGVSRLEIIVGLRRSSEGRKYNRPLRDWTPLLDWLCVIRPSRLARPIFSRLESRLLKRTPLLALPGAKFANELFLTLGKALDDVATRRVGRIEKSQQELLARIGELEKLLHQNRRDFLYAELRARAPVAVAAPVAGVVGDEVLNAYYVAFEDANRGSRDEIRTKQMGYIALLDAELAALRELPVLDVGCGRGEWLALLAEHGYRGRGIDLNPVMVGVCRDQGLAADCADILSGLAGCPDASLAAVTSFHVVEHLPFPVLFTAIEQAWRALAPGGLLILETPNPENLLVGSHTFYHDFTHRNPVTPSALSFLVHYLNFADIRIERLNPYPESAKVPGLDLLTERVNGHLCGPQDFAVIARKPRLPETAGTA